MEQRAALLNLERQSRGSGLGMLISLTRGLRKRIVTFSTCKPIGTQTRA